jgi:hypothetical protein
MTPSALVLSDILKIQSQAEFSPSNALSAADGRKVPSTGKFVGADQAVSSNVTSARFAAPLLVYVPTSNKLITVLSGDSSVIDTSLENAFAVPKFVGSSESMG